MIRTNQWNREQLKAASQQLPEEQQKQLGGVIDQVQDVGVNAAGAAGGAVKGVLDTAGNAVNTSSSSDEK